MNCTIKVRLYSFILAGSLLLFTSSCKKEPTIDTGLETSTLTDVDGNVYATVKIGNQWWMAENLRVKKYNDTTDIIQVELINLPDTSWANKTAGAYCVYLNDSINITNSESAKNYGILYNWYAISDTRKIAPKGWHIPSDEEWKEMEKHLGMSQGEANKTSWRGTDQGNKLKIKAPEGWTRPLPENYQVWGNNESGFTAIAGACSMFNGRWGEKLYETGFWWTSSSNGNEAWYRHLDYKYENIFRYYGPKTYGFSVRCVKD